MKIKTVLFMLLLGLHLPAFADDFDDAAKAYQSGDYATALKLLRPLAEQGLAEAQNKLGVMYDSGNGVPQDYTEAVKWFSRAAEQGNVDAQFNLGGMYDAGLGVPQNYVEAVKWYRLAAEQGDALAQTGLAMKYALGEAVPQDYAVAYMWVNIAAASGNGISNLAKAQIASNMTPAEIAEGQKLAKECVAKNYKNC